MYVLNLFFLNFSITINKGILYIIVGSILGIFSDGAMKLFHIAIINIIATKKINYIFIYYNFFHILIAIFAILCKILYLKDSLVSLFIICLHYHLKNVLTIWGSNILVSLKSFSL